MKLNNNIVALDFNDVIDIIHNLSYSQGFYSRSQQSKRSVSSSKEYGKK